MSYCNYVLKISYHYIDNSGINNSAQMVYLYKDGLRLSNYGKDELANNFIDSIVLYRKIFFRWAIFG